jgi:predicted permease
MKAADFRIGWRLLLQERAYSAVTIFGLALGFAACFLLMAYVRFSFSYDSHVPQADRVYVAKNRINILEHGGWFDNTPINLLAVAEASPLAEAAAVALTGSSTLSQNGTLSNIEFVLASPAISKVLGLRALEGDLAAALERPEAIALTESKARQLLGAARGVLGKTITMEGKQYQVLAVLPDLPAAATLHYALLAGTNSQLIPKNMRKSLDKNDTSNWGGIVARLYVRLAPGATPQALQRVMQEAHDRSPFIATLPPDVLQRLNGRKVSDIALTALRDWYFDRELASNSSSAKHGDARLVLGVAAIGALILLLAAINYVNLATVRVMRRRAEIAMRKVLGASHARVAAMLMAESLLASMLAAGCGLLLAWLVLPAWAQLLNRPLATVMGPGAVLAALAVGLLTGVLAGLHPAWLALRVRPVQALAARGGQETYGTTWLRRGVTVFQMTCAMALVASTLAVAWQTRYASSANPGFDAQPLLVLELPALMWQGQAPRQMRDALLRVPGVEGVAASPSPAGRYYLGLNNPVRTATGVSATLQQRSVSPSFFQVYGVAPLAGRSFDPQREQENNDDVVVLNAAAAKVLGFASPQAAVGQSVALESRGSEVRPVVIGVVPDLRYQSLRETPAPVLYRNNLHASVLTVRYHGDMAALERAADALWRQYFPDTIPEMRRATSYFAENYDDDARLAAMLAAGSAMALLLSAFGIYVLAAYNVQRRAREIVLRKLYGAQRAAVARLLGKEFAWMLGCAALLGLPPAALAIQRYLSEFAERAPVGYWTLLAALGAVLAVALGATIRHTLAALRISPALALRS